MQGQIRMAKRLVRMALCLMALAAGCAVASGADWQPLEKVETYAVPGTTGPALYASIGERGPQVGGSGRAIAYTNFRLTWSRDYQPRDGGCTIASARPKLIITYTLPKAVDTLSGVTRRNWDVFIAGVREHEKVHGRIIEEMVRKIEAYSVGLTVADDPECRRIRKVLTERLTQLSLEQRQRSRDFDRDELGNNGNIQQLVLMLVNGG